MIAMKTLLFVLIFLASGDFFSGKVIRVSDGDTIVILTADNTQTRIRLDGIDCPETGQDYGQKAKQFVADLCAGKTIKIENKGIDRYKRVLGVVIVDGVNVNEELVRNGLAWHYKHFSKSTRLDSLERLAKSEKLNIWSVPDPIAPWDFRKQKKK